MHQEIIMAGFGGQGILLMGQFLTYAGMLEGKNVVWFPSYGPEMRGGEAYCNVIVADDQVGSPVITRPDCLVIMTNMSVTLHDGSQTRMLARLGPTVKPGGLILLNSTLVKEEAPDDRCRVVRLPATGSAEELGNQRAANVVMLGALIEISKVVSPESVVQSFKEIFPPERHKLIPLNEKALEAGRQLARNPAGKPPFQATDTGGTGLIARRRRIASG